MYIVLLLPCKGSQKQRISSVHVSCLQSPSPAAAADDACQTQDEEVGDPIVGCFTRATLGHRIWWCVGSRCGCCCRLCLLLLLWWLLVLVSRGCCVLNPDSLVSLRGIRRSHAWRRTSLPLSLSSSLPTSPATKSAWIH